MLSMGKIIFKIFVLVSVFSGCSKNTIDKIYYNGTIWTGDYKSPFATAMVLYQEKFIFVGQDADALDMASNLTEMIDLKGNFVTPGFIDNHVHFISGGLQLSRINLNDVSSKHEFQKISVEDALRCYTLNKAYAAFWEKTTGSISVGKNADFVVHSLNYFDIDPDKILESKILRTVVGGKDYLF